MLEYIFCWMGSALVCGSNDCVPALSDASALPTHIPIGFISTRTALYSVCRGQPYRLYCSLSLCCPRKIPTNCFPPPDAAKKVYSNAPLTIFFFLLSRPDFLRLVLEEQLSIAFIFVFLYATPERNPATLSTRL